MLMSISAERSRSVRFLAGRTDRSLRVGREVFHDAKRTPISRPYNKRFIYELAIFVGTRSVQRHTYVGGRPWWTSMQVPSARYFKVRAKEDILSTMVKMRLICGHGQVTPKF